MVELAPDALKSDELEGPLVQIAADGETSADEKLRLWIAAGGRCAFCGRYLLENEETGDPVRIGEMAHIVGRSTHPRSPRGKDSLPASDRNKAENLVLACPSDHTTIDKSTGQRIWQTDDLRRVKAEHEGAVKALTALTRDRETTVLRVAGSIRGHTPSISKTVVHDAVHADLRFPQYRLGAVGADVEIDLVTNFDEGGADYFQRTDETIARRVSQIAEQIARGEISHISLFAFARIPVLVQLGHHLDDKWPVEIHQFDRMRQTWSWDENASTTSFEIQRVAGPAGESNVTLILSLSGHVDHDALPVSLNEQAIYEMKPVQASPSVNLFRTRDTLTMFVDAYLALLAQVERDHPLAQAIDIVPSIGLSGAVELGRRRTRSKHPALRVWDQDTSGGGYSLATIVS
jgi:hypothetical protein